MTASEASRSFSAVLDCAEHGETIVVTRGGRRIATIAPAPEANGAALHALFDRWRGSSALDADLEGLVHEAGRAVSSDMDIDPWRD